MEETLKMIALQLNGFSAEEMSKAEINICKLLVKADIMIVGKYSNGAEYFSIKEKNNGRKL